MISHLQVQRKLPLVSVCSHRSLPLRVTQCLSAELALMRLKLVCQNFQGLLLRSVQNSKSKNLSELRGDFSHFLETGEPLRASRDTGIKEGRRPGRRLLLQGKYSEPHVIMLIFLNGLVFELDFTPQMAYQGLTVVMVEN